MPTYLDLARRFVHRPKYEPHEVYVSSFADKRLKWPQVLENRFAVVIAPANYGKTTEMVEQVKRMRLAGGSAECAGSHIGDRLWFEEIGNPGRSDTIGKQKSLSMQLVAYLRTGHTP